MWLLEKVHAHSPLAKKQKLRPFTPKTRFCENGLPKLEDCFVLSAWSTPTLPGGHGAALQDLQVGATNCTLSVMQPTPGSRSCPSAFGASFARSSSFSRSIRTLC